MSESEVDKAIEAIVRDHIHSGEVVKVLIDRDEDMDDSNVITVRVIFRSRSKALDVAETSQLARHVWKALIDLGEQRFPSLSFIDKSEAGKLAAA